MPRAEAVAATGAIAVLAIAAVTYAYLYTTVPKIHEHFTTESKKQKALMNDYDQLKKKYLKNTQETVAAKEELKTLTKNLRLQSASKESGLNKGALLEYDVEKAQAAYNKVNLEVNSLKSYLENLQKEYIKTGKTLDTMKTEYAIDKEKCTVIDTSLLKSKGDYTTLQKEVEGATSQISELKKQLALMTTKNDPLATTLAPVLEDRQKQKLELDKKLAETGAKLKAEMNQQEQLKKKLTLDEEKLAKVKKQHGLNEQLLVKTEAKFKSESSEKKKREVDLKQLNDSISVNDGLNKKLQEDVNKMREKYNKATKDGTTVASKIVEMRTKTTNQSIEIKKLQQAVEEMTKAKALAALTAASAVDASFMVMGGRNKLAYTTDGKNAIISKSGTDIFSNGMAVISIGFNGKQWVAAGGGDTWNVQGVRGTKLAISSDGINWNKVESMDKLGGDYNLFNCVIWTGSKWIINGSGFHKYYSSTDGVKWTQFKLPAADISAFAGNDSILVAGGLNVGMGAIVDHRAIWYSTDGATTWANATSAEPFFAPLSGSVAGVSYNGKMFVAVGCESASGANGTIIYSTDGINWNKATNMPRGLKAARLFSIHWNGKIWLACGQYAMYYSKDGINWLGDKNMLDLSNDTFMSSPNNSIRASMYANGFAYDGKSWHVASNSQNGVWSSVDGINWTDPSCKNAGLSSVFGPGEANAIASAKVLPW